MIKDLLITPLNIIETQGGNVLHAMKEIDKGFVGFSEAYFSEIDFKSIKAWKRHKNMTLNLTVPVGEVKFVLFDDRDKLDKKFQEVIISRDNYCRLTVPPMIWVGFQGLFSSGSTLLNIANIIHDVKELERKNISEIHYDWSK